MENETEKTTEAFDPSKDDILDSTLRPKSWKNFVGQEKLKKNLEIIIEAAKKRKESSDHILFYGESGMGKTSLSHLVAREMDSSIRIISGPTIERPGDLAAILTNLLDGDVLFCDECHRIPKICEELMYSALEDFKLNIIIGKGPMAKTIEIPIPKFTLIGATTRIALLSSPLRNRFGATFQLNSYKEIDIEKIIKNSSIVLNVKIEPEAVKIIAKCSRFTPRVANRLLKRVRDFAQVEGKGIITEPIAKKALEFLEIDEIGLETGDKNILQAIIKKFRGGPVGLQALSASTSEGEETILDIYEPYLMQIGFIERTPRGRIATKAAYEHLKITYKKKQNLLL